VREILALVSEQDGELARRLAAILYPEGEGEDTAELTPLEGEPEQNIEGRGTEAFDDPPPFRGRPEPGGTMTGDAAMAYDQRFPGVRARVGIEPDYRPTDSISAYDNWGRPTGARPIARNSRSGRHTRSEAAMALDARSEHSYAMVFPDAMKIGLL
jgi:hypothetical protein